MFCTHSMSKKIVKSVFLRNLCIGFKLLPLGATLIDYSGGKLINSFKKRCLAIAMASSFVLLGTGLAPATASESSSDFETTVQMSYGPFDKTVAAANGYDIRVDDRGVEYSIVASTPVGITDGAKYIPGTEPTQEGVIKPRNTTFGDCGTATLTGIGRSFYTAYAVTDAWAGPPVSHTWRVSVSAPDGYQVFNLDGLAPAFSNTWSTSRSIPFRGLPYDAYVSTGKVYTGFGFTCYAYNPSDHWSAS